MLVLTGVPQLSIVIPAYNEAKRIGDSLQTLSRYLRESGFDWEIRVVDDGSEDETAAVVTRVAREESRITLQPEPHRGKGGAVRAGMLAAAGALRFMCDADLSMPVRELRRFLDLVPSRADIAIGSREGSGARRLGEPAYRHLLGRGFNHAVRVASLPGIDDTQCGFKLFTAEAVARTFPYATISGWAFDVEVLVIARQRGLRIVELPIEWHYRDQSRVSAIRDPFAMMRDVLKIRRNRARGAYAERP